jgi:pilus assembly protein CpaE
MSVQLSTVIIHRDPIERGQLRAALEALQGVQVVGERPDLRSGIALAHQAQPQLLVMELSAPIDDGLSIAAQYHMQNPNCAIFLMTDAFDSETLLRALRAGAQEILRRPLDRSALSQAVERVAAVNAQRSGTSTSAARSVLTVFSIKGGSGISTIAVNLGVGIRTLTQREVAIADFDYHSGDAAFMLGITPKYSVADVVEAARIDSASVQDALMKHRSGLKVLPQPEQLDRVANVTPQQVGNMLEILNSTHDRVVVDCPHAFNEYTLEIFDRSSTILLVTELSIPSVRAARRSLDILAKLNFMTGPDRVRLVVNRFSNQSAIDTAQIEDTLGMPVFGTIANDYASVSRSINMGEPLCEDPNDSKAARDILALARKLVPADAIEESEVAVPARRSGRLRFFGKG